MPTLVIRGPDGTLVERELVGKLTVGCDDDNDLVLRSGGVEKRHANFFADGGEVVLEQGDTASAAETLVDGEPMRGRRRLAPGVRVVIGGYEVQVKPGKQLTVRKLEPPPAEPSSFPFKLVFAGVGAALVVVAAVGLWRRFEEQQPTITPPPAVTDPCADLEPHLRIAREGPSRRALDAVEAVLVCDPLHAEGNALKRSIPRELEGQDALTRAKEFVDLERDAQALEALEKIPSGTEASRQALPLFNDVATRVMNQEQKDCDAYSKAGKKSVAQPHCAEAARLRERLTPAKADAPKSPPLADLIKARVKEPQLAEALVLYAAGRHSEAITRLQKIRETDKLAALHAKADAMRKDISNADALAKVGEHALARNELERGAKAFSDALELDERLVPERGTALRSSAEQQLAERAYQLGQAEAQHENWVKACAQWKVGFGFTRASFDLNRAVNACTQRATRLLTSDRCKDLDEALKLAIPGDDLAPQIEAKRQSCRL